MQELLRTLAVLLEPPTAEAPRFATLLGLPRAPEGWEHQELFGEQLYPFASVYLGAEGMLGGEARDRVAGFWRALGEEPPPEPDHLSLLLGLLARLSELEAAESGSAAAAWRRARTALLWEHVLSWVPVWLDALAEIAVAPYAAWGRTLDAALAQLAAEVVFPDELPTHLRAAPTLPEPAEVGADEFLRALLAPVRSGCILTRTDLARLAHERDLALRAGERRYVLRALLSQDAGATLGWLSARARAVAQRERGPAGPIREFWRRRALAAATLLARAGDDAGDLLAQADDASIP